MAVYRTIHLSFWTDSKVVDDFSPEDKYFYLYLLTNPHCNLCGCYEISLKQISDETGYNKDTVEKLLERFENKHRVIKYCKDTKEILLVNWSLYNWTSSEKLDKPLREQIEYIKNVDFADFLADLFNKRDTVSIPYAYGSDTSVTVTVTDTVTNTVTVTNIIKYLNNKLNTNYKANSKKTVSCINARLNDGFVEEDFIKVIDKKYEEWKSTDWEKFLRPETLFGNKFEGYLNQRIVKKEEQNKESFVDKWRDV